MAEVQSLARGLQILDLASRSNASIGCSEVADYLGVDRSTASRLMQTLANHGYLAVVPKTKRMLLGRRLYEIKWGLGMEQTLRELSLPILKRLSSTTGECAHLAVYSEGTALVIEDVEVEASLRVVGGKGRMIPLHCTAVGKALLAFDAAEPPQVLQRLMPNTIVDHKVLDAHLELTRQRGYAFDDEEHEPGVRCLAAPVFNSIDFTVGTIGISGPTVRVTSDRIEPLGHAVIEAARELSSALGHVRDAQPIA